MNFRGLALTLMMGALIFAACAAPAPTATPATPAVAAPSPTKAASTATPTKRPLRKVSQPQGGEGLPQAPTSIGKEKGYFLEEGLDMEIIVMGGGQESAAAVVGGSAEFAMITAQLVADAVEEGGPLVIVSRISDQINSNVAMRKDVADRLGITAKSPIPDKIRALKGMRIGLASAAGITGQIARYLLNEGGMNPDRDAELTVIGSGANQLAALRQGAVEVIIRASPYTTIPVLEGWAIMLFDLARGEVPSLAGFPNIIFAVRPDYAQRNPEVVLAATRALTKTFKFIRQKPDEAKGVALKVVPNLDLTVLDYDWEAYIKGIYPEDGVLSAEALRRNLEFIDAFRDTKYTVRPEQLFDNRFAEQAKRELANWRP